MPSPSFDPLLEHFLRPLDEHTMCACLLERAARGKAFRMLLEDGNVLLLLAERRYRGGVNGNAFRFRIPGYGMIAWAPFIAALREIGYDGGVAIEHEDAVFSQDRFDEGLVRGRQVLGPLIHPV